MPAEDTPASLVARFLRQNGYAETLDTFLNESGLPSHAGSLLSPSSNHLNIERLLEEKRAFDLSLQYEKLDVNDEEQDEDQRRKRGWGDNPPSSPNLILCTPLANILHVSMHFLRLSRSRFSAPYFLATTSSRDLHIFPSNQSESPDRLPIQKSTPIKPLSYDSPILSLTVLRERFIITGTMSGRVTTYDAAFNEQVGSRSDHNRFVVRIASSTQDVDDSAAQATWIATAGWDGKVLLYYVFLPQESERLSHSAFPPPVSQISLPTNPEGLVFVPHPETSDPVLVISRRDSTQLYFYSLPHPSEDLLLTTASQPNELQLIGKQNLAPNTNSWVSWSPSCLSQKPYDPTLVAVGTSSTPHMRLLVVRLLLPPAPHADTSRTNLGVIRPAATDSDVTQSSQAREKMAKSDKEEAAIQLNVNTFVPQSDYSTPVVVWRAMGRGIWCGGDDGVIRGIDVRTGKVVKTLNDGGHDAGSRVRCLCTGMSSEPSNSEGEEWLLSGGFDKKLIFWR